ncbi:MAG: hypothetical protein P9X27_04455 [Candidatus Kaelpia aquatica]|nr:hypothetical protein [Candidatus Kaelpia aquatica]
MVKFVVLILGVLFAVLGVIGVVAWWPNFLIVLKGGGCPFLAFIGAIMAIAAVGEIRDAIARKREEEKEPQEESKPEAAETQEVTEQQEAPQEEPKQE